jgi:hypothetical protein
MFAADLVNLELAQAALRRAGYRTTPAARITSLHRTDPTVVTVVRLAQLASFAQR